VKLRPDHKLSVVRDMTLSDRVKQANDVLQSLVRIVEVKA
jgi:hypothetical protein